MALTRDQKKAQVAELKQKMTDAQSVVFAHYIGLTVAEVSELRAKLREVNAEMQVAKKTLMKIAAKDAGLPDIDDDLLDGPVSLIFNNSDPLSGAQVAFKFAKKHDKVELIGAIFDGKLLSKREATELAMMPSRDQLLAIFAMMIRSPLVSFARMSNSPLIGFARAMSEVAKKGGTQPQAAAEVKTEPAPEAAEPASEPAPEAPAAEAPAEAAPAAEEPTPDTTA